MNWIILDSPKIFEINGPQFINSIEESKYVCKVKGNPIPTIEWYLNTTFCTEECKNSVTEVTANAIFKTDLVANTSILSLNASQPGILSCIGKNSINGKLYTTKKSLIISGKCCGSFSLVSLDLWAIKLTTCNFAEIVANYSNFQNASSKKLQLIECREKLSYHSVVRKLKQKLFRVINNCNAFECWVDDLSSFS